MSLGVFFVPKMLKNINNYDFRLNYYTFDL